MFSKNNDADAAREDSRDSARGGPRDSARGEPRDTGSGGSRQTAGDAPGESMGEAPGRASREDSHDSSRFSRRIGRLNLRLSVLFSSVFLLGAALLFAVTFFSLYKSLSTDDVSRINARLLSFWAEYKAFGINRLLRDLQNENLLIDERPFLARIADADNNTVIMRYPPSWAAFNLARLGTNDSIHQEGLFVMTSPRLSYRLEIGSIQLAPQYYLQIGMSTQSRQILLELFRRNYVIIAAFLVALSFVGGLFISSRTFRPVGMLNRTIRSIISTGQTDQRIPVQSSKGELDELVVHFNKMLERIDTLIREMRQSLDAVAHDLRTPMTRLRGVAELALKGPDDAATYRRALETTIEESDTILRILNTMMDISEAESGVMRLRIQPVPLDSLVEEMAELYRFSGDDKKLTILTEAATPISISGDPVRLRQVIANLLDNAVKYTPEGGTITVDLSREGDSAVIRVRDTGVGIPADEIPRIWNRLYRVPAVSSVPGLGLGLSLVKAIVEAHKGRVSVSSRPGEGTTVGVYLPIA